MSIVRFLCFSAVYPNGDTNIAIRLYFVNTFVEFVLEKLSKRLLNSRKKAHVTQKNIALKLDIHEQTVIKYEQGKRVPNADTLKEWAEITKCNPAWLLTGQGEMIQTGTSEFPKVEEGMVNYNDIVQGLVETGDDDMLKEVDHLFAKIARKQKGMKEALRNLPKKA